MAAPPTTTTTVLERCQVAPPQDAAIKQELKRPLLHFDILFLQSRPKIIIFYKLPNISKSHFLETILPPLKNSLSLSLKHFLPLAGNVVLPTTTSSSTPLARYAAGDSVCLTVAESTANFRHLTGDPVVDSDEFENFVPQFSSPTLSSDSPTLIPAITFQITFFPSQGISIGFTFEHSICDGAAALRFFYAWASINKSNAVPEQKWLPSYDRATIVQDPHQLDLQSAYWNQLKKLMTIMSRRLPPPPSDVTISEATFVLTEAEIQKLMNFARRRSRQPHLTSFTVVCAHLWVCFVKLAAAAAAGEVEEDEPEYFICPADCKALVKPALPPSYFGNCLALVKAEANHRTLKGEDGFLAALTIIGESIQKMKEIRSSNNMDENSKIFNPFLWAPKLVGKRVMQIVGSPRFDMYGIDFGWGRMEKYELISDGKHGRMSLCKSKDEIHGGVEISIGILKTQVKTFSAIFHEQLRTYQLPAFRSAL